MEELIKQSVHKVLAQSYLAYFLLCIVGIFLGLFIPIRFSIPHAETFAAVFFIVGPLLIFWAQQTSRRFEVIKEKTGKPQFNRGPYRFLRNPTQLGLVILVAGYACASGTAILFITSVVAYIISNTFFKRHEAILESRYGDAYRQYKATVHKVL